MGVVDDVTGVTGGDATLWFDIFGVMGDVAYYEKDDVIGVMGDMTGVTGDITGVTGDITGVTGDVIGLMLPCHVGGDW